jgi:hypothetical protein
LHRSGGGRERGGERGGDDGGLGDLERDAIPDAMDPNGSLLLHIRFIA